jgi:hypothetical protein
MEEKEILEDVNRLRDDIRHHFSNLAERAIKYGFNIAIVLHTYDPMSQEASYSVDHFGDELPLIAVMQKYINNQT